METYYKFTSWLDRMNIFFQGKGGLMLTLLIILSVDWMMNTLGTQILSGARIFGVAIELGVDKNTAGWTSVASSGIISLMLGFTIMQSVFHNRTGEKRILGALDFLISLAGIAFVLFKDMQFPEGTFREWPLGFTLTLFASVLMAVGVSYAPVVGYNMISELIVEKYGAIVQDTNSKIDKMQMDASVEKVGILSEIEKKKLEDLRKRKGVEKKTRRRNRQQTTEERPKTISFADFQMTGTDN